MPRETKKRVGIDAATGLRTGLNAAFAGLDVPDVTLKLDPTVSSSNTPDLRPRVWKMGRVVLRRETAHRGGRTVIVVHDFATHLPASVIEAMAKKLRAACGCGGTVRERTIEIQGEQAAKIRALLEAEGFQVAGER